MSAISTGNHPAALWPGVRAWWGQMYDSHEKEYPYLMEEVTSDKNYEEEVQLTGFGLVPVKPQGAAVFYDTQSQGFTKRYTNVSYGMGYIVTWEELEDNQYAEVSKGRAQSLAFSTNQSIETICANMYNRAFNSSYTGGDGKELLATDHDNTTGGTWSNELATGADLSEAALEDLIIQIAQVKSDRGHPVKIMPQCLLVHPSEWFNANRILKSSLQNNTADNAVNALKVTNALPQGVKMNHYFDDADNWFVKNNCPNSLKLQWRKKPEFDQDNDFDTKNARSKVVYRLVTGWTDPRGLFGSQAP